MDSNFIIEFDKSFELQSVEAIAKQLKSRGFLTEEESKLLSQFLLNKAKCDGQSVLKCAELVAELKDWRFSVKNSDTLSECIEACLKNELSSLQNGIDRVECRKSIVRFIGNLFKLQVLHQETFDSWKNFLEESNNIVLANYLTASVRPNSTDQGCAFMKATEKTVEPQIPCYEAPKHHQILIPKINSLLKKGNSPALESFRNFVRKLFTDNEIYFDFKSLETYAQINKGILAEIIIEKLKTLRTAEKIKKLVEIVMKIEERSKKKGILQQFIFKIRQKIDKIPKPTSQKSKEKVIVWDEVFAYGMAISELYNNNIQCDLLRLWFQTIQSHAVIGVEPAKESIQYVFQNCEESMKKNDKRLFESCKYLSKAILNQKVVSHETKELAEGNSRSGDLCKKERVVKDFQSIDFHEKGVYSLDFESSMNKLKRGFHTRFDFNEYLDWNLDRYKTCALILFNYATEKGSRSKAFVDFVIRTTRFSKQNANFRKSVVTVTKEKFDDQVQQGNLNDETIVLLGELYNANFVSSLSMVEILEKFKTFSDTSKIEMIIDIIKGKVLNHKEQTLSLATMSLLSIVENYEKLNEENPQNLSNVQEKEMIVVMLMQFDASTDVSFIESLTPVKDLKTLEECSQVLVQKVIADCSLTEKCVRILGKILNFNDINSRDAVMDPIQIEFENVFVADVEIQLQKSTETAFSVINFIGKLNKAGIYTIKLNFCCLTTLFEAANTGNENCLRLFIVFLSETSGYFTEKKILPLEIFAFLLKQRDSRVVEAGKMKETANEGKKKQRKVADVLLNDLQEIIRRMENSWNDLKNVTVNESTEQVEKFEQVLNELNSKNFQEIMKKLEELEASSDDTSMREYAGMLVTKANMMPEVAQNVAAICLSLHEVLSPATKAERFRKHLEEAVDFVFDLCLSKTTKIHQGNNAVYFICHLRSGLIINKLKFVSYIEKLLQNRDTLLTVTTLITVLKTVDHKMISCEQLDNVHLRLKIESLGYDFKGAVKTEILQIIEKFERKKNNENKQAMDAKEWIEFLNGDDLTKSLAIRNFELMIKSLDQRSFQVVIEAFQSCDLEANAEIDGIVKYFLTAAEAKEKVKSSMFLQLAQKFHEKDKSGKFKKNLVLKLLHEVTEILTQAVNSTKDDQKFLAKIELFCDFHGIGWIENVEIVNFVDKLSFEFVQSDSQVEIFHCLITKIPIELIANCKNLSDLKTKLENVSENEISCKIYLLVIEVLKILENILSKSGEVL